MLANRVKETTSTTGTGSFITTGAASGFQTFNTAFGTNRRFTYWAVNDTDNEWETGIGYLSASTTLVRETVLDSSNSGSVVNFTTAPTLFCGVADVTCVQGFGTVPSNTIISSAHFSNLVTDFTMSADTIYYVPFLNVTKCQVDGLIGLTDATAGTETFRVGIYNNDNNSPGSLIAQTNDLTGTAESFIEGSITAVDLPIGWLFMAIVADASFKTRRVSSGAAGLSLIGDRDGETIQRPYACFTESAASWTQLPATAGTVTKTIYGPPKTSMRTV